MRRRSFAGLFALGLAVLAAACGTSNDSANVPPDSVAVVGDKAITKSEFDDLVTYAKRSYATQKRPFPKVGTPEYVQIRDQAMALLVQRAQFEVKAKELGVDVSDEAVNKRIDEYIKERHKGNRKAFEAELKQQGLSDAQARDIIRGNLVQEGIYKKVTSDVKIDDKAVKDYYAKNKSQYGTPDTRVVRHVLVKDRALAKRLYNELKAGGNWNTIAKKYSQDPASKNQGGKMTATRGQLVPEFEEVAFSLGKDQISIPIKTQYGWHVIQALSNTKKGTSTPFNQVKEAIRQQLAQDGKNKEMEKWVADMRKDLKDDTAYQVGYKPTNPNSSTAG
ncbi:MAG TPA: peptidylprolyl isomerase [Gaiellaceae bacterium]|jgi:foldase protein PrsA|nr:peptidylprolyl isomerase [Gaiellaceae bacterium]